MKRCDEPRVKIVSVKKKEKKLETLAIGAALTSPLALVAAARHRRSQGRRRRICPLSSPSVAVVTGEAGGHQIHEGAATARSVWRRMAATGSIQGRAATTRSAWGEGRRHTGSARGEFRHPLIHVGDACLQLR